MQPNLGLNESQSVAPILCSLLADEFVLYTKTRKYHWNVTGKDFITLHQLFEEQYTALADTIDEIAERIRALGVIAPGTLSEFQQMTRLKEAPGQNPDAKGMIQDLLSDYEQIIRTMRSDARIVDEEHHDAGTSGFLESLLETHEKTAWMLRSHLE